MLDGLIQETTRQSSSHDTIRGIYVSYKYYT